MKRIDDLVFVVDADGTLITATGVGSPDTVAFSSSDPTLVASAKRAATTGEEVEFIIHAKPLVAGWDSPMGILAALLASAPGRSYIKEAPEEVLEAIHELSGPKEPGVIY